MSTPEEENIRQVSSGGASEGDGAEREMKAFNVEGYRAVMTPAGGAGRVGEPRASATQGGGEAGAAANLGQAGAASGGSFWGKVKKHRYNISAGRPVYEYTRTCGRPLCLDPTGHGLGEPFIMEMGPEGVKRAVTCAGEGCNRTLKACDLPASHLTKIKASLMPRAGLQCIKCLAKTLGRPVYGSCPSTDMAVLARWLREYVSGVRDIKDLFVAVANPHDDSEAVSSSVIATFMQAIEELAKGAPKDRSGKQGVIVGVSVQKTAQNPLKEMYSLWDGDNGQPRAGMEAFRRTLGAKVPGSDGSNLLLAAHSPVMPEAHACTGESAGQFGLLGKVLNGESELSSGDCKSVPLHGLFTRATCAGHQTNGGRQAPANGQGSGVINNSCVVLGVWLCAPEEPLPAIVDTTPVRGWERIGEDDMADCAHPRIAYGTSRAAILKTRSAADRDPDVVWPRPERDTVLQRCRDILGANKYITTFASYSPKPWDRAPSSIGSDKPTVIRALQHLQRAWGQWKERVLKIYNALKESVYDRQDNGKTTWAELNSR